MARQREEKRVLIDWDTKHSVFIGYNGICAHCGKKLNLHKDFTLDHFIPLSRGGRNEFDNYVALCKDCNSEKDNGIAEPEYYMTFAPEKKIRALRRVYDRYIKEYDFLAHDCAMKNDFFELMISVPRYVPKARKLLTSHERVHIRKLKQDEAFDILTIYAGRLAYTDKELIVHDPENLTSTYYMVSKNDKDILMFSPYFADTDLKTDVYPDGGDRKALIMEMFSSVGLNKPDDIMTGAYIVAVMFAIMQQIQLDLDDAGYNKNAIELIVRSSLSDKAMQKAADSVFQIYKMDRMRIHVQCDGEFDPDTKTADSPAIIVFNTMLFIGDSNDMHSFAKDKGSENIREYVKEHGMSGFNESMADSLDKTEKVVKSAADEPKKHITPSQKKSKYRKVNAKKRRRDMMTRNAYFDLDGAKW